MPISPFPRVLRSHAPAIDTARTEVPTEIGIDDAKAVAQDFINTVGKAAATKARPFPMLV